MTLPRFATMITLAASWTLLCAATPDGGCGQGLDNRLGDPGVDVGGVAGAPWRVVYSDQLHLKVKDGGALVSDLSYSLAAGGTIIVAGVPIDVRALCQREDVACPHEVFPQEVVMTQAGNDRHLLYVTYNRVGSQGKQTLLGNVDSDDDFSIALGAALGACGLSVSYATGHIDADPGIPPRGRRLSGEIVTAYSSACLTSSSGGGLTYELGVPFTATRLD